MKVFVQYPEGLKNKLFEIEQKLREKGYNPIFDAEPTYGFCDLKDDIAIELGCEAIIHIGHNSFGFEHLLKNSKIPIIIEEYRYEIDEEAVNETLKYIDVIKHKKLGIVSSLQYLNYVYYLKDKLKGFEIVIPKNPQILGCNVINAKSIENKVDAFLIPTDGKFYSLGLALQTNKPVYAFDLGLRKIYSLEKEKQKYLTIKWFYLSKFEEAKKVGILVSWKKGQLFYNPYEVKEKIESLGKKAIILAFDEIDPNKIIGLDLDFYVNLACPRIFDNYKKFDKPILNWVDIFKHYFVKS